MSRDTARPQKVLQRVTRHSWGPDPARIVIVAVFRESERTFARVIGAESGHAVEIERVEDVTVPRSARPVRIVQGDGTEWVLGGVGCSCHVPGPLKGVNVLNVPAA